MTEPDFFVVASLAIGLFAVLLRSLKVLISDAGQNHRTLEQQSIAQNALNIELDAKLRRTYIDLSMSRRQTAWRDVLLVKIVEESEDVRSFYLIDTLHEPLPAAQAGQHILLARPAANESASSCRCYSLSDDCSAGHWRISVKKNSVRFESVSRWLHEEVEVGETLRVRGPSGAFYLRTEPGRSVVLACAGIGITPMIPMLMESIRRKTKSIRVYAQFRDLSHMPFADSLLSIAAQNPQLQMNIWISRFPKGVKESNDRLFYEGKFQAAELTSSDDALNNTDYYFCGPEAWQSRMVRDLIDAGVSGAHIDHELFQPSEKPHTPETDFIARNVHFRQSSASAKFESSHPSLLGCASKNKVSLESGCRTGACGTCAIRLLKGRVRYTREPQFQLKSNEILPCICVPETDLVVDA